MSHKTLMHILVTDHCHPVLTQKLVAAGFNVTERTDYTYDTLKKAAHDYDALVVRSKIKIDQPFLAANLHLRCIGRLGAGMDAIDINYAEHHGIRCLNSPEGNRDAVGEHAVGLLLALFDKICIANNEVRQGLWHREENRGLEIKGKTIGLIGYGNMGQAFAKRLSGFDCRVIYYDKYHPTPAEDNALDLLGYHSHSLEAENVTLAQLLQQADVISFHVPLTDETHHYLNDAFVEACAKPFFLVNTCRGAVVQTDALVKGLERRKILGAALDVIEYEDMTKDGLHPDTLPPPLRYLLDSPHTVLTPHVAGWTQESRYKLASCLADKIIAQLQTT